MPSFKSCTCVLSAVLLAVCVFSSPAPPANAITAPHNATPTPPALEDGTARPGCTDQSDCLSWVQTQCKPAKDLFVKPYCFDEYCYALCPPIFPSGITTSFVTIASEMAQAENTTTTRRTTIPPYPMPTFNLTG